MVPRPLPLTSISQVVYRYSNYDTPFWVRPNTKDGRWHEAGDGPTQYLSLSTEGAWAELIRAEELRSEDEVAMVRMPLWEARVDVGTVVDYSDFSRAEDAGFAPDALIADNWRRCQEEGRRLRQLGYAGVLAPSAALPGALNLTLFGPKVAVEWESDASLASAVPAKVLTIGSPPFGLLARIRHYGESHSEYRTYARAKRRPGPSQR
jgi:RES domain-containing protein